MVTKADLKDQFGMVERPILYCEHCGAECSAHAGDYFHLPAEHVFTCHCGEPMKLVRKRTIYEEV